MKYRWWAGGAALAALFLMPQAGDSCGPFLSSMRFTTYHGFLPDDFTSGHLGVVRPHFWREDLLLAYRAFSGVPLSDMDDTTHPAQAWGKRQDAWLLARLTVAGAPVLEQMNPDRKLPGADYEFYPNCLDGAFQAAAETLKQRVAQWGAQSPKTAEWLRGQDQVFQNCSSGAVIPADLPSADADLAADRQYQIAAAEFYAEQYDKAEAGFDRIASQSDSPWHGIAPYLAARASIRQATIGGTPARFEEAGKRLQAILDDPARKQWHESAKGLLEFVQAHVNPRERLVDLGNQLMQPDLGPRLGRILTDYTKIWDSLEERKLKPPVEQSDVAAWIATFQSHGPMDAEHRARHTLPWLIAALVSTPAGDPSAAELIREAHAVPADSPGYASAVYYGILRQIRAGELEAARQWADDALAKAQSPGAVNLLRAERLRLARSWPEFLRYATRKPVVTDTEGSDDPMTEEQAKKYPAAFAGDAAQSLNQAIPLSLWIDAVNSQALPESLRAEIAQAGWVRAVLLNDAAAARTMAERTAQSQPQLRAEMRSYLGESDPAAARFAAVFLLLRGPGFQPVVRPGFARDASVLQRDLLRDNWWLLSNPSAYREPVPDNHEALYDLYPDGQFIPPDFPPKDQRAAGEDEWRKLVEHAGNGVNYLCAEAIAWAHSHPREPRVPQALHLAVEATHYGPADKSSSAYSKQAFDLLHRNYPNSEWTRQTKYWY